ncbi:hypothetical protein [Desulfonema magnum]|uniref:Uncharacterized protein n=1 Tax=Desulfonema magnum TaxID=45655 RepID=A0A975GQZ1_9BACT|nr:hypothetical protein [Desulfonema magnum]QTA90389.1 Uncharacterized protein dnm_064500 [Desulfonema magnum]
MSYGEFTLKEIKSKFGIRIKGEDSLFSEVQKSNLSDFLSEALETGVPLARGIGTDKARSEFIIAPVLAEVRKMLKNKISLFSGINFNVNQRRGLSGLCDFILTPCEQQLELTMPVLTVVAAKNENINAGIPQCMAEMIGSRIFNAREGNGIKYVFGCVTTGTVWKFLKYNKGTIFVDIDDYYIREVNKILGIFLEIMSLFIFRLTVFPCSVTSKGLLYNSQQLERIINAGEKSGRILQKTAAANSQKTHRTYAPAENSQKSDENGAALPHSQKTDKAERVARDSQQTDVKKIVVGNQANKNTPD